MTFPQQITRYECPIESCDWTHDDAGPDPFSEGGDTVEEAARNVMIAHVTRLESVVRAHLETHSLLEWVTEVMRLRFALNVSSTGTDIHASHPA